MIRQAVGVPYCNFEVYLHNLVTKRVIIFRRLFVCSIWHCINDSNRAKEFESFGFDLTASS